MEYTFFESKSVAPDELNLLFMNVGWGRHTNEQLRQSIKAYPYVAHARTASGVLVGYLSAFSDEVLSTLLGELVVHPDHQRQGIAAALLARVEAKYPTAPVYIKALGEAKHFFMAQGYQPPRTELTVLFKKPSSVPVSV